MHCLSWVPKLMASNIDKPNLKTLPTLFFSKLGKGLDIFNTRCGWTDLIGMPKHTGEFWRNAVQTWLKLRMKFKDELPQSVCPKCTLWNNNNIQYKNKNLHLKDWINKGMFKVKYITNNRRQIISFEEVECTVGRAPHRLFEYNTVKTGLEQARECGKLCVEDHEEHELQSLKVKHF